MLIDSLHSLEELDIHQDLVGGLGDKGCHFLLYLLHLGGGITLGEIEEHALDAVQNGT